MVKFFYEFFLLETLVERGDFWGTRDHPLHTRVPAKAGDSNGATTTLQHHNISVLPHRLLKKQSHEENVSTGTTGELDFG